MKILIAEDEPMILKTLSLFLSRAGHNIVTAIDGKSAIELFDTEKPDLVVTDLMMPFANGTEFISYIRHDIKSKIPIVVVTTVGLENTVLRALELGANDYITKPFQLNDVIERVNRLVYA